jgi:hypothetical protein
VSATKQDLPDKCARRGNKLDGLKEKDLIGIPWMLAFALRADGWYLRQDIIWHKPNPMPESVRDRCTKSHEYLFLLSKNKKYYYDNEAIKEPAKDWGTRDRTKGKYHNKGTGLQPHSGLTKSYPTKNKRSVWSITNKPYKGAHFAVFPPDLIIPCIKAGSEKNDIILDPFIGSGTTAMVAKELGRYYIGCELHEDYGKLIQERVNNRKVTLEHFIYGGGRLKCSYSVRVEFAVSITAFTSIVYRIDYLWQQEEEDLLQKQLLLQQLLHLLLKKQR